MVEAKVRRIELSMARGLTTVLETSTGKKTMSGRLWWLELALAGLEDVQGRGEAGYEMNWTGVKQRWRNRWQTRARWRRREREEEEDGDRLGVIRAGMKRRGI